MIKNNENIKDVSLNGGVLIIGSLYWDKLKIRADWRASYLNGDAIEVTAPIRYGRISNKRNCTFTMVFSTECNESEKMGKAKFLSFKNNPINIQKLNEQANWLMKAEREKKTIDNQRYFWEWGTLGICVNPTLLKEGHEKNEQAKLLLKEWSKMFSGFKPENYKVASESSIMSANGEMEITWDPSLTEYDFIIATATIPEVDEYPLEKNIADRMLVNGYDEYFLKNMLHGITTFQDEKIIKLLKEGKV
jgi:hypothetical protein